MWLDGEELASVKSFEAKVNLEYEDVDIMGELGKHKKIHGIYWRRNYDSA